MPARSDAQCYLLFDSAGTAPSCCVDLHLLVGDTGTASIGSRLNDMRQQRGNQAQQDYSGLNGEREDAANHDAL
jgi:hypothetical protein